MNRQDIIRMAREAGAVFPADGSYHRFEAEEDLERFAALVASAEREACAKVCDAWQEWGADGALLAKAIRARGQA